MEKVEAKERLKELTNLIKTNSKDAHYAENLLNDYKHVITEILHKPSYASVYLEDVEKKKTGKTYEMAVCKDGTAVYKVYGGYTVVVEPRLQSLAGLIEEYINVNEDELTEEERENLDLDLSAFAYIMSAPIFACSDFGFKYEIASLIVQRMQELYEDSMSQELHEDTKEDSLKNAEFQDAVEAVEHVNEELENYELPKKKTRKKNERKN
jgi:hypothetical protein